MHCRVETWLEAMLDGGARRYSSVIAQLHGET